MKNWLFAIALVVAIFLAYKPAWRGGFIFDDDLHLLNNPVLKPGGLASTWLAPGSYINYWPLTFTVYRLEFETWGLNLYGFHLVNIALHVASVLLLWRVLVEINVPGAMVAAAIFALHPVNVESVAWIAQLKGLLSLLFALVSALLFLQFDRRGGRWRYGAAIAAFCLSTLSKGMVLTLPIVLLACAWWRRGLIERRDLLRILPYVLIGAFMTGVEIWSQQGAQAGEVVRADGPGGRIAVAGCAVWFYLGKLLWPFNLCFVYPLWKIDGGDLIAYLPGLLLALLLALGWRRRRSWGRPMVMLIVCYVALLLPALGLAPVAFMRYSLVADHYQYAAVAVPCAVLTGVVAAWAYRKPSRRWVAGSLGLSALVALAGMTWRQSRMYADEEALYRTTIDSNPRCWVAHYNLGVMFAEQRRFDEAIVQYRDVLKITEYAEAHNNLGNVLADLGQVDEAIAHYREALKIKPNYASAHFNLDFNLGRTLADRGQIDDAVRHYRRALVIKSDHFEANSNLGRILAGRGQIDDAIVLYRRALATKPDDASAPYNLGFALASRGAVDEAITNYRKALLISPDYFDAHVSLGNALSRCGQFEEAIMHYRKALQISPGAVEAHVDLGNALSGCAQADAAIAEYRKALEIKPDFTDALYNLGLELAASEQVDEAMVVYRKALTIDPDYVDAHLNLADVLAGRGRLDEALEHYQKALRLASERGDTARVDAIRAQIGKLRK